MIGNVSQLQNGKYYVTCMRYVEKTEFIKTGSRMVAARA